MDDTSYDEFTRHLAKRAGASLIHWLLQLDRTRVRFDSWLDSGPTLPGMKDWLCGEPHNHATVAEPVTWRRAPGYRKALVPMKFGTT